MATSENTPRDTPSEVQEHTVSSSRPPRAARTRNFSLPSVPRMSFRNIATRTKALSLLVVFAVGLCGGFIGASVQDRTSNGLLTAGVGNDKKIVTSESQLVSTIAKNVGSSVVSVNVEVADEQADVYSQFFGGESRTQQAAGTGVIISKEGLVLTNRHVVPSGATSVSVTLSDGTELDDVEIVGRTNDNDSLDIAVLKITDTKGKKLPVATLGDSSKVAVGDEVVAIGNALGQFQNTVTTGIISGFGRSIVAGSRSSDDVENLENLFQTDAAINQGNSGGPLVNLNGQVIGINTAVASDSQNIGFAIPINDVKGIIDRVLLTGKLERPYLGVRYVSLTEDIAKEEDLSVAEGAYIAPAGEDVNTVIPDGPAAKAGLKTGDVITKVNDTAITKDRSLTSVLAKYQPGDKVTLTVVRDKDTRKITLELGVMPTQ